MFAGGAGVSVNNSSGLGTVLGASRSGFEISSSSGIGSISMSS